MRRFHFSKICVVAAAMGAFGLLLNAACDSESSNRESSEETADQQSSDDRSSGERAAQRDGAPAPPESVDGPMVPRGGSEYSPSLVDVEEDEPNVETLTQTDKCGECHSEVVKQWRDSVHAFASFNNPMYRMVFDEFVEAEGHDRGKHCAGCHDPVPLVAGDVGSPIAPDSQRAHVGVTCNTCHGITDATTDGNGSYTLTTSEVPVPEEGDPESLERHKKRVTTEKVDQTKMCASCHRGFLSEKTGHDSFIFGFDEYRPWRRSGWNGNPVTRVDEHVANRDCVDCHMPEDPETGAASHRFPGGHSAMAEMIGSEEQLESIVELIEDAATIDVAAAGVGDERMPTAPEKFSVEPGGRFWVDVVVRNVAGGHNLPGGQRDLRDTWFEVVVRSADGELLAEAGRDHRETGEDKSAHRLRKLVLTPEAETEATHGIAHFRTKAFDKSIPPRNAEMARYAWTIPDSLSAEDFPLVVEARLQHRRLSEVFYESSCEAAQTERGRAFLDGTEATLGTRPDPCVEQPIVEMAKDTAEVYPDRFAPGDNEPGWRRWFARGLAMQKHLSERLDETIDSFERAMEALESMDPAPDNIDRRKAMILVGEAQVLARQRRHREAIELYDRAEKLVGDHPAILVGRGDAYANVWQFDKAVDEYEKASEQVDGDRVWKKLAVGYGSLGQPRDALRAARRGLAIEPRHPDLLRSQMIALRNLDVPEQWQKEAARAFSRFKRDEDAHRLRAKCSDRSEICELERLPIHTHEMESVE